MPAKPKPAKPKNIAYTTFIGPDEYCVLKNNKVIHIHPHTGSQTELTLTELSRRREVARNQLTQARQPQREKSQEIIARLEREDKAR